MKTIRIISTLAIMLWLNDNAFSAETAPDDQGIHGYVSSGPQHGYIGKRISRQLFDGWMEWTELQLEFPKGFFVNIWDASQLENLKPRTHAGDEMDLTAGWRGDIPGDIKLRLSTTLFNLYPKDQWWEKDAAVQSLWLTKEYKLGKHSLIPEMRLEWISKTSDFGGGALVTIPNITHVWREPFGFKRVTLYNQPSFARDDGFDGPRNNSKGIFYRWDTTLDYHLGKNWHLCLPNFALQVPLNNPHDGREHTVFAGGISLKRKF